MRRGLAVALALAGAACGPSPPVRAPLTVEVVSMGACHPDTDHPEEGLLPRPNDYRASGEPGAVRVTLANLTGSCPEAPAFFVRQGAGEIVLEVRRSNHRRVPWRTAVVVIHGVPSGRATIGIPMESGGHRELEARVP